MEEEHAIEELLPFYRKKTEFQSLFANYLAKTEIVKVPKNKELETVIHPKHGLSDLQLLRHRGTLHLVNQTINDSPAGQSFLSGLTEQLQQPSEPLLQPLQQRVRKPSAAGDQGSAGGWRDGRQPDHIVQAPPARGVVIAGGRAAAWHDGQGSPSGAVAANGGRRRRACGGAQ